MGKTIQKGAKEVEIRYHVKDTREQYLQRQDRGHSLKVVVVSALSVVECNPIFLVKLACVETTSHVGVTAFRVILWVLLGEVLLPEIWREKFPP